MSFLNAYQTVCELNFGEIWALASTLRVLLVENLRRLAEQVATSMAARQAADEWCDALIESGKFGGSSFEQRFKAMARRGVGRAFALQVNERLNTETGDIASSRDAEVQATLLRTREALGGWLPDPSSSQVEQHAEKAADSLGMRNAILALRTLEDADWREVVTHTSVLVRTLEASPTFCAEREDTQDASLFAIQRLARRSTHSESFIASHLLTLMGIERTDRLSGAVAENVSQPPRRWGAGPGRSPGRRR